MTTGEGGVVVTNDNSLAKKLRIIRNQGQEGRYNHTWLGNNYRMTDIQAALGLSQMERLDQFVERRHIIAQRYDTELSSLPIKRPLQSKGVYSAYHLYPIRISIEKTSLNQRQVYDAMQKLGIQVNLHYIPVYLQPYYEQFGFKQGYCPEAEKYHRDAISIPMYASLSEADQTRVISVLHDVLG